jgi:hypothetical protein
MTSAEITEYLHAEELVPVVFLRDCPGLGFIVNQERDDAVIPKTYHASIPFWLASILGGVGTQQNQFVRIEPPPWLQALGPGAHIEPDRSYDFGAHVGLACGADGIIQQLIELGKERIQTIVDASFQIGRRDFDIGDEKPMLAEEKEIVDRSQRAIENFRRWKSGGVQQGSPGKHRRFGL